MFNSASKSVVQRLCFQLGDAAIRIVDIAEDNRLGRTGLLASGHDLAVAHLAIFFFRADLRLIDALHAVGAFFHNAAGAHRDVRIMQELGALRFKVAVQEEIEATNFIGTVIRTVAGANAAIVGHVIEPFVAMGCRMNGTNQLARSIFALHARHRLMIHLGIVQRAFVVTIDANPMHLPTAQDFLLTYHRAVIFGDASDDAGIAADARVDIDSHAPGVTFILESWIETRFCFFVFFRLLSEVWVFAEFFERGAAQQLAPFHQMMELGASERLLFAGFANLQSDALPMTIRCANEIGVEASVRPNPAGTRATITEMDSNAVIRLPRQDPCGTAHSTAVITELDHVAVNRAMLAAGAADPSAQSQAIGGGWTYDNDVVPSQLGQRLGCFLKPAVIGKAAVQNRRIGTKQKF